MASTNGKQFLQDDASAATPTTSTACTKATSAAAADVPHFTAAESASASSWSRCSSPEPPPAFPAEGPRPEPRGASTGGGSISPAARFEQRGNTVTDVLPDAASEYSGTSWSGRSFLPPRPASLAQVTWPQGKGTGTSDESYSTWTGAIIDENKSSNTKSGRHVPIQALLGESVPYGSRYWEHHDCPYNLEGLNPPGFFSPHPVWEGFSVPVTGGRSISPAARVEQKGNTVADVLADAASEYSGTSWSGRSFLPPRPASPAQVTWPQGKGTGTSDESYSTWTGATIDENKSSNPESDHHVPIQALQGESAPYGSRFWEQHDCPYNLEGMNPPGFFSPHPVWEGFVVPVQKEGRKASFFCVACAKVLSGNATRAQKHLLSTKGCVITEERKTDLKARIKAFEERRTDLKRKRKESKEGISQGDEITKNADEGLDQISGTTECSSSAFPHLPSYDVPHVLTLSRSVEGAQKATQAQLEPDQDQISSSDRSFNHCFTDVSHFVTRYQDNFGLTRETDEGHVSFDPSQIIPTGTSQEPDEDQVSSFNPCSQSCPTAPPSTGGEGSDVEEPDQDELSTCDPLSFNRCLEPDEDQVSSFNPCSQSCSTAGPETVTAFPSNGGEGSEGGEPQSGSGFILGSSLQ